ncbi:MAG TPA: UDP-phosphate N-acetylglucosaminyl 1-phosphate transferase [Usitatibacter sp.]|nr:UDP-phosphate N-acetylglucosaminyl 1-phosphate transferase [Usitatibacter sp.]
MRPWELAAVMLPGVLAWLAIALLRDSRWAKSLTDHPNARSLHASPTPRVGGLGVMAGALPLAALIANDALRVALGAAAALSLLSLADDIRSLPIEVRLPAHVVAAAATVFALGTPLGGDGVVNVLWAAAAIFFLVWMTNLFNFMDGSDGLAGGMALIGFAALAAGAGLAGDTPLALVAAALASASAGFLAHNYPPARVFLGDSGSIPLGFLAGALGAYGFIEGVWAWWFAPLVFSPFIVDATVTIAKRLLRGERIWVAHRTHLYQRLVLAGWSSRRLALSSYALMAAAAASALYALQAGPMLQSGIILSWAAAYLLLFIVIDRRL